MSKQSLLIKNGHIVDPSQDIHKISDILITDGRIKKVGNDLKPNGAEVFDATCMLVFPGLIDMHAHLREPGGEESETIKTGCESAAAGGFTAICAMPNTTPPTDDAGRVRYILERAKGAKARVYPIGAITRGRNGKELVEMHDMAEAGAAGFSDDGSGVANARIMLNALRYADMVGKPVLLHEEDADLAYGGQMNESALSAELGLKGLSRLTEDIPILRDTAIAEYTGTRLHITHVSTRGAVEIIRTAKNRGVKITCDVTPHHLTLTEILVETFDTRYKMKPPLRTADDVKVLIDGLRDSTIDAIATDHAPHSPENKEVEFVDAAFGVTGFETALGVIHRELVSKGILTWPDVVRKMSLEPSRILGVEGGTLEIGSIGDVTIYNPDSSWNVDPRNMKSKSQNTAFFGWELPGKVIATVVGGVLFKNE
ncbi:MAG: dihydroorotase [Candidatus Latescibacteria bacterium]|nr:dihydroorotase [Candidatus Latescibacterota bacterium]